MELALFVAVGAIRGTVENPMGKTENTDDQGESMDLRKGADHNGNLHMNVVCRLLYHSIGGTRKGPKMPACVTRRGKGGRNAV
jgi:hypothetical protein